MDQITQCVVFEKRQKMFKILKVAVKVNAKSSVTVISHSKNGWGRGITGTLVKK